uniref:DOMON domain-containing protein n=1 Tax=Plectus sambesii TaxID=2011161 RepID=A0A914WF40_9BILA
MYAELIAVCFNEALILASSTCQREYKHPTGCEGTSCDYIAKWEYSPSRKDIRFEISAREIGRWTGIGFSRDGGMTNSDIYTGWFYEGKAYVTDRFAYGRQLPAVDPSGRQDIYETGGRVEDDIQTIWFRRKIVPEDTLTDFPLDKCYYFLFPVGGGRVLARKAADFQDALTPIGYHDLYQPRVSREKICICDGNGKSIAAEEEALNTTVRHRRQADPFSAPVDPQVGLPPKASGNGTAEAEPSAEPSLNGTSSLEQDVSQEVVEPHEVEPHAEGSANNTTAAHAEPEPGSEPTSSVEPEPEAHDHADHAHSEPEPHPEGHASNETHTEAQPEPETSGEPTSEPHGDHDHDHDHAHAEPEPHPTGEATAEPHSTGEAEPEPHPTGESEPEPHPTGAAEPEPHPTGEAEPEPSGEPAASPKAPAGWSGHPMDCADIVVGTAIGMTTQVRDYYTVSRATPRLDEYYGGKQSITSASGFEEDGVTTIVFRKKLLANDKTDHSIVPGPMTVIWAKGQQYPNYVHNVEPSVFAVGKAGNEQFYENDVLLYHGAKSRGVLTLDFFEGAKAATGDCNGMFAYPTGCTDAACTYIIKWTSDGKTVSFQLDTALPVGHWSGIGFSKDGSMNGVDALVAIVEENGSVQVSDQFAPTYGRPIVDPEQGVFGVAGQYQNGRLMANFSRNLDTNDAANDLSLTECQFFLYPHSGGALEGGSVAVRKHTSTPTTSTKKICLKSCSSTTKDVSSVSIPTKKPNSNEPDVLLANSQFFY